MSRRCSTCNGPLMQRRGFHGSGMCGPCFTGEADTARDMTSECQQCGIGFEFNGDKHPHPVKCLNCLEKP